MVGEMKSEHIERRGRYLKGCLGLLLLLGLGPWVSWDAAADPLAVQAARAERQAFEAFAAELLEQIDDSDESFLGEARLGIAIWPFSDKTSPLPAEVANEYNAKLLAALVRRSGARHRFVARETLGALVEEVRELHGDEDELDAALSALLETAQAEVLVVGKLRIAGDETAVASYRAVKVADGTIIAASTPRPVPVPAHSFLASRPEAKGVEGMAELDRDGLALPDGKFASTGMPSPAPDPRTIESVQRDLRSLGYDPGPIDGRLGPLTVSAIRAYQANIGTMADGRITAGLVDSLRRSAEAKAAARPAAIEWPRPRKTVVGYDPRRPYCREYQRAVWIGGRRSEVYGTACLQPDGSWQIVD